jgi:hypothetical protein
MRKNAWLVPERRATAAATLVDDLMVAEEGFGRAQKWRESQTVVQCN